MGKVQSGLENCLVTLLAPLVVLLVEVLFQSLAAILLIGLDRARR